MIAALTSIAVFSNVASAQSPATSTAPQAPSSQQPQAQQQPQASQAQAEKAFAMGNTLMEQRKPEQALVHYKEALSILPNETGTSLQRRRRGIRQQGLRVRC